jgi:hypothetical protein
VSRVRLYMSQTTTQERATPALLYRLRSQPLHFGRAAVKGVIVSFNRNPWPQSSESARRTSRRPGSTPASRSWIRVPAFPTRCCPASSSLSSPPKSREGSGLGLAQVYGFAMQSGRGLSIETRVGRGTAVKVYLPRISRLIWESLASQTHRGLVLHLRLALPSLMRQMCRRGPCVARARFPRPSQRDGLQTRAASSQWREPNCDWYRAM